MSSKTFLHIDDARLKNNIKTTRAMSPNIMIMAVVKANAYGHDIAKASKAFEAAGVNWLGVASVDEAITLRKEGITLPILALSSIIESEIKTFLEHDISVSVFNLDLAVQISKIAKELDIQANIHIKIDTGMNRFGFKPSHESFDDILSISKLENISVQGIFSHFATADSDDATFAKYQFNLFNDTVEKLSSLGLDIPIKHMANSAAFLGNGSFHLDMVRLGILLYGLPPCSSSKGELNLEKMGILPALSFKSHIAHVKDIKKDESIGYGQNFVAKGDMKVATLPLGYSDGVPRALSNRGNVLINGHKCPIVGNVCMNQMMVDVSGTNDAQIGDEVILIGIQGGQSITPQDWAVDAGTINYEIVAAIPQHIPRH